MQNIYLVACYWLAFLSAFMTGPVAYAQALAPAWQVALVGTPTSSIAGSATDAAGNVYVVGSFTNTLQLGSLSLISAGGTDVFVAKWSPLSQSFVWGQRGGGTGHDMAGGIAVQGSSIYISGSAQGPAVMFGSFSLSAYGLNAFVAKLTDAGTSGSYTWVQGTTGPDPSYATAVAVSGSNVYIGGSFGGASLTLGSSTVNNFNNSPISPGLDLYVAKLTDTGTAASFVWAQAAGGSLADRVQGLAVSGPNVYAVGDFTSPQVNFGSVAAAQSRSKSAFVTKLTDAGATGSFTWVQQTGGGVETATAIVATGGAVYVAGNFNLPVNFGSLLLTSSGNQNVYVTKLTDAGATSQYVWAQSLNLREADALAVSGSSVYVAGQFDVQTIIGNITLTPVGFNDLFVAKLTDTGTNANPVWAQRAGGVGGSDLANALAVVGSAVYVAGSVGPLLSINGQFFPGANGSQAAIFASLTDTPLLPTLSSSSPSSGPVGTAITLTGTNLTGATAVTFAGPGSPTVTSGFVANGAGTQLTGVVVPGGATSGLLSVTTPAGTSIGIPFTVTTTSATAPLWQQLVTATGAAQVDAMTTDASGNVLVAGTLQGTVVFGATTLSSAGSFDAFVAKWSPATNGFVWAQRIGGTGYDHAAAIALNGNSVYVGGEFTSPTLAIGSTTLTNTAATASVITDDVFLAKLTDAGSSCSFVWAQRIGGNLSEHLASLAVQGAEVYAAGDFNSSPGVFGTINVPYLAPPAGPNAFVAKLTDAGPSSSFTWAYSVGNAFTATAVAVNGSNVYVTGFYGGNNVTIGSTTLNSFSFFNLASSTFNVYVAKLTDAGPSANFVWAQRAGGPESAKATAMAVSGSSVYIGGTFGGTAYFGANAVQEYTNNPAVFVAKLTDTGTTSSFVWAVQGRGPGLQELGELAVHGTDVYLAGQYANGAISFGTTTLPIRSGNNRPDGFLAKISDVGPQNSIVWAKSFGGFSNDIAYALALDATGNVYTGGYAYPLAAFDGLSMPTNPSGGYQLFIAGLSDAPVPAPTLTAISPGSGAAGTILTLTGTNLTGATAVAFAGMAPQVASAGLVVNAAGTQLTGVLVPVGAISGLVTVTTPGGTSNGLPFTVAGPPANDEPSGALALVPGADCTLLSGTAAGATPSSTAGLSSPAQPTDVFYTFVATNTVIDVQLSAAALASNASLELYRGPATSLVFLATTSSTTAGVLTMHCPNLTVGQPYYVRVNASTSTGTGQPFALCAVSLPGITSLTPLSGPIGTVVTLAGSGLSGATSVRFTGGSVVVATGFIALSATSLQLAVPAGTNTGPLTVNTPAGPATTAQSFTVTAPQLAISQGSTAYMSGGAAYSFGAQILNTTSATVRFILRNAGTSTLTLTGVAVSGDFSATGVSANSITAGGTATVDISFLPTAIGPRLGMLLVVSNAGNYVLNLSGTGQLPLPVLNRISPPSASAGTMLTISGVNLLGATSLTFNGVPQPIFNATNPYQILAAVPAGAALGPCPIVVTTPGSTTNAQPFTVTAAPPAWQTALGSTQAAGNVSTVWSTAADANGNVYVGGYFQGTISFGSTTLVAAGLADGFVAKWSRASGTFVWAQSIGNAGTGAGVRAVAVQGNNIYIAGYFGRTNANNGGSLTLGGTTLTTTAYTGMFVAKLVDAGSTASYVWAKQANSSSSAEIFGMAVNGANVYVTGWYGSSLVLGTTTLPVGDIYGDVFVAKLTDAGPTAGFTWAQWAGGSGGERANGIAVSGNSVYIAGRFNLAAAFGNTRLTGAGQSSMFLAKLTDAGPTGSFVWAEQAVNTGYNELTRVAANGANVYFMLTTQSFPANFGGAAFTSAGYDDVFVAKLTDTGPSATFGWSRRAGGPSSDFAYAIVADGAGGVYIAGSSGSDFADFGVNTLVSVNTGNANVFVCRLTDLGPTGQFDWVQGGGSNGQDGAESLAVNGRSVYVGGYVEASARFGSITLAGPPSSDRFSFLASLNDPLVTAATAATTPTHGFAVFPNPAHGTATVLLPAGLGVSSLTVLDVLGRTVHRQTAVDSRATLNLIGLPAGLYVVRMSVGGRTVTQRLVVEY